VDMYDPPQDAVFEGLIAYKNESYGAWTTHNQVVTGATLADNRLGFVGIGGRLDDSLVVGRSSNAESLGRLPVQGAILYGGVVNVSDVTFAEFRSTAERPAGAIGFPRGRISNDLMSIVSKTTFVNAQPVFVDSAVPLVTRSLVIRDADGSISGGHAGYITAGSTLMRGPSCTYRPEWLASTCPGTFARFYLTAFDGAYDLGPVTLQRDDGPRGNIETVADLKKGVSIARFNLAMKQSYSAELAIVPKDMTASIAYGRPADWIVTSFSYPHGTPQVSRYRTSPNLRSENTIADLYASSSSTYHYDHDTKTLTVKLVVPAGQTTTHLAICSTGECP
jgi:hypothetical protein